MEVHKSLYVGERVAMEKLTATVCLLLAVFIAIVDVAIADVKPDGVDQQIQNKLNEVLASPENAKWKFVCWGQMNAPGNIYLHGRWCAVIEVSVPGVSDAVFMNVGFKRGVISEITDVRRITPPALSGRLGGRDVATWICEKMLH